jgi:hypothetical protein
MLAIGGTYSGGRLEDSRTPPTRRSDRLRCRCSAWPRRRWPSASSAISDARRLQIQKNIPYDGRFTFVRISYETAPAATGPADARRGRTVIRLAEQNS